MLPSEEAFSAAVSALGIYNKDGIIVYDGKGIFSAARVWWYVVLFSYVIYTPCLLIYKQHRTVLIFATINYLAQCMRAEIYS